MKLCGTCGTEINDGAVVCTKCGCAVQGSGIVNICIVRKYTKFPISYF